MATISEQLSIDPAQFVAILDALGVFDDDEAGLTNPTGSVES